MTVTFIFCPGFKLFTSKEFFEESAPGLGLISKAGRSVALVEGFGDGAGVSDGFGVGEAVGFGVGFGVGEAVGFGVGEAVGFGVGAGVGLIVGVGSGVGVG